ncbi:MAG: aminotransferase class I/II-fold pyridoxal phosphate-dependent enzyme [Burkholderiales bacterium]|jgi:O-acetylhomoserine (thiol)-lyase|nr:aminotransferase class I/II-fold pyridoxal phosphate-dependent enzyme [Burkholderiales bacterium]
MKIETLAIHAGYTPDPATHSVAVPIYQTVSYAFDNAQHGADLFDLKVPGNIYTRIMNPTNDVLEKRVAALEGGVGALALSSGMAAITAAIQTLAGQGDNIVSAATLYGGTYNLFAHSFPTMGINVKFADSSKPETFRALIDEHTKALYAESVGNPLGNITDIEKLAEIAHEHGLPLIIDNTVPTPFFLRPHEWGADIVVHSLTKGMGGHGTSLGGMIVDSGKFDWKKHAARFSKMSEPDRAYHGVIYTEAFGAAAYIGRARVVPLRNMGAALSPFNAFLILQGIETMSLRQERISENTKKIVAFLKGHRQVSWVKSAVLPDHPDHALLQKYMNGHPPGILSFGVKPKAGKNARESGAAFLDALKLFTRLVNIGDAKSLATHPASTTHRQLNAEELYSAGVSEDMVRLSVGIEHIDDLIDDLAQAL